MIRVFYLSRNFRLLDSISTKRYVVRNLSIRSYWIVWSERMRSLSSLFRRDKEIIKKLVCLHSQKSDVCGNVKTEGETKDILDSLKPFSDLLITSEIRQKAFRIISEYNVAKERGHLVPSSLTIDHFKELLLHDTTNQRKRYFIFLFKKEKRKSAALAKKKKSIEQVRCDSEVNAPGTPVEHGRQRKNTFLINSSSARHFQLLRLAHASIFGQKIVIDMDYEDYMSRKEISKSAHQLFWTIQANLFNTDPFDLHFCNARSSSGTVELMKKKQNSIEKPEYPVQFTELSYLDLFPKEQLVYLSPHAETSMELFDPNAIYIIGAFVDSSRKYHISQERAKKEGLKCYSLPLKEHVMWGSGTKSLSMNQVFEILLRMKDTRDWKQALAIVPRRKLQRVAPSLIEELGKVPEKLHVVGPPRRKNKTAKYKICNK